MFKNCLKCNKKLGFSNCYIVNNEQYCKDCYDILFGYKEQILTEISNAFIKILEIENQSNATDFIREIVEELQKIYRI